MLILIPTPPSPSTYLCFGAMTSIIAIRAPALGDDLVAVFCCATGLPVDSVHRRLLGLKAENDEMQGLCSLLPTSEAARDGW